MNETAHGSAFEADWFDGLSARPRRVRARLEGERLHVHGDGVDLAVPLADVRWPERTRHGRRVAHLRGGESLAALDAHAYDAWAEAHGLHESWIVKAQQNWRATLIAVLLLAVVGAGGYLWGVPWLARGLLVFVPASVDRTLGEVALRSLDQSLLLPSRLPAARQEAIRDAYAQALRKRFPDGDAPPAELRFRTSLPLPRAKQSSESASESAHESASQPVAAPAPASAASAASGPSATGPAPTRLGPNAFALPGGTIVVTDELVALLDGRDDVLLGVIGHELGHVQHRHGMRLLAQAGLIGAATSVALGDFNSMLAAVPALLGQQAYSRGFEREADDEAVALLRANGISPDAMVELFERLGAARGSPSAQGRPSFDLGIALASHPADSERIARFRAAAAR